MTREEFGDVCGKYLSETGFGVHVKHYDEPATRNCDLGLYVPWPKIGCGFYGFKMDTIQRASSDADVLAAVSDKAKSVATEFVESLSPKFRYDLYANLIGKLHQFIVDVDRIRANLI